LAAFLINQKVMFGLREMVGAELHCWLGGAAEATPCRSFLAPVGVNQKVMFG
jgi:hypothetical protein